MRTPLLSSFLTSYSPTVIMQLRIRTLYGERVSLCLTLSFVGEIVAVTALQVMSIMGLHNDGIQRFH